LVPNKSTVSVIANPNLPRDKQEEIKRKVQKRSGKIICYDSETHETIPEIRWELKVARTYQERVDFICLADGPLYSKSFYAQYEDEGIPPNRTDLHWRTGFIKDEKEKEREKEKNKERENDKDKDK
jgi:hypothetical protein